MRKVRGMTLVEMIIAIVLMGIAMAAFTSFLIPQVRDSAIPHYQNRAAALAQGFMSQILARGFDDNSSFDGGLLRCGEGAAGSDQYRCTSSNDLGAEEGDISSFNDVDDYIGCWYTQNTKDDCDPSKKQYQLSNVLGDRIEEDYRNFRVDVSVSYVTEGGSVTNNITDYKRVTMTVHAGQAQPMTLITIRGNY